MIAAESVAALVVTDQRAMKWGKETEQMQMVWE
jgi:hypothetical protein